MSRLERDRTQASDLTLPNRSAGTRGKHPGAKQRMRTPRRYSQSVATQPIWEQAVKAMESSGTIDAAELAAIRTAFNELLGQDLIAARSYLKALA